MAVILPSNPADRIKIKGALVEISNSMTRIDAEKDLIKEIISDVSQSFQLPKKYVAKIARVYHKQSYSQEQQESEEFEVLYETIVQQPAE